MWMTEPISGKQNALIAGKIMILTTLNAHTVSINTNYNKKRALKNDGSLYLYLSFVSKTYYIIELILPIDEFVKVAFNWLLS